jgi:uncharacterized membrane protein YdjX (TVP38/TMEM64 family)
VSPSPARRAWLRFSLLVALAAAAFLVLRHTDAAEVLDQQRMVALVESLRSEPWAPFALLGLYLVLAPMGAPVTPLVLTGGAVFGTWLGALLNFVGLLLGGTVTFGVGRLLGRELVDRLLGARRAQLQKILRQHGFWALVRLRFIPFPYVLVNLTAAVLGIRLRVFLTSTALAFAPAMLVYSYFASSLVSAAEGDRAWVLGNLGLAMLLFLGLTFVPTYLIRRRRRARLERLREGRRERRGDRDAVSSSSSPRSPRRGRA